MKKITYIFGAALLLLGANSCDKFFDREPIEEFSAETFFANENDLKLYTNGMLNAWLPNSSTTNSGDDYNDLVATKTSADFYRPDAKWSSSKQGSWGASNWAFLRRCNYMLQNMSKAKDAVDEDIYNHYEGVARFWRAYQYTDKVDLFSNVPWIEAYLQPSDTAILYAQRDDREYVFHKMREDLEFAAKNCMADKFHTSGRTLVDKYVVNLLAARFFLKEATFRMNVDHNPATNQPWTNQYETVNDLLQLAADCAKRVIDDGVFKLSKDYSALFLSSSLNTDEVIWGRTYSDELGVRHGLTRYYHSSTLGQQYSGTKELVNMFLKTDGTPVDVNGGEDQVLITEEFKDKDTRLAATILGPGHAIINNPASDNEQIDFTFCKTGYMVCKWSVPDATHTQNSIDANSLPILRYPEALLIYAEAMNELGKMSESIWNSTVGALRERAGVKNIYPGTADYTRDQWLLDYYTKDLKHAIYTQGDLDVALEIRRERVTELSFECGLRADDVYRYGQADLISRRYVGDGWRGIWVGSNASFDFEGQSYTLDSSTGSDNINSTTNYPISAKATAKDTDWYLQDGYLVYKYVLNWEDKMYCRPIPVAALNVNPNLGQNYGWE